MAARWTTPWKLSDVLPGALQNLGFSRAKTTLGSGNYTLLMRAINPLRGGKVLRFGNQSQDQTLKGWLTLAPFYGALMLAPLRLARL